MPKAISVLIIEDSADDALLLIRQLRKGGYQPEYQRVASSAELRTELGGGREWDIVLSDFNMPGFNGYDALAVVLQNRPHLPFIVVSGAIGEETAAALVKAGAFDYLLKGHIERLPLAVAAALREATEVRKLNEAQALLRHNEEKFRRIFELAGDAIYFFRLDDGRIIEINQAARRRWGGSRDELLEKTMQEFIAPEYSSSFELRRQAILSEGNCVFESAHYRKDGSQVQVEVNCCLVDYFGEKTGLAIVRDITERKQAADLLKRALAEAEKSRDEINAILCSVTDGLLVTDMNVSVKLMNLAAEEILHADSSAIIGKSVRGCGFPRILADAIDDLLSSAGGEMVVEWEIALPEEKHLQTIRGKISEVRSYDGERMGAIVLLSDITKERELDRMKKDFITTAAHELNTPLAAISGFAELLLEKPDLPTETRQESLQYVVEKTEHLGAIIDDLLNLSRLDYGLICRVEKRTCSLNALVKSLVDDYRTSKTRHNIELCLAENLDELSCDKRRVSQVIDKLLDNAVKFSPSNKPVRITTKKINGYFQLSIHDEGIGMTAEQMRQVFNPFFRVDTSDTAAGGFGLGMCVAKNIIESHGGTLCVDSKPGEGTTVTFRIPSQH